MSETKIVVPEGMLKAFRRAWCEAYSGDVNSHGLPTSCVVGLEASLRWLAENPIVPPAYKVVNMMDDLVAKGRMTKQQSLAIGPTAIMDCLEEWQRRMFLAPEPEIPEALRDILLGGTGIPRVSAAVFDQMVLKAYRRGQKSKETQQ